jgi:NitT/TauT family transport system substrate-binding protein
MPWAAAISMRSPLFSYTALTRKKLGTGAVSFQDKDIYRRTFNVVATREFIGRNPGKVENFFAPWSGPNLSEKSRSARIAAKFNGLILNVRESGRTAFHPDTRSTLFWPEDESRWAIKGGLTEAKEIPNYLDFIYVDGLKSVKPEALMILR